MTDLFAADRANFLIFDKRAVAFEAALQAYPPPPLSTDDRRTSTEQNSKKYTPRRILNSSLTSLGTPRHVVHGTLSALAARGMDLLVSRAGPRFVARKGSQLSRAQRADQRLHAASKATGPCELEHIVT